MDWFYLLQEVIPVLVNAIITIAIPLLFALIRSKVKNDTALKLIEQAETLAVNCVNTIEQTIVLPMKSNDTWDSEQAAVAYETCKQELLGNLNQATIDAIKTVYVDVDAWAKSQIEAQVLTLRANENKTA